MAPRAGPLERPPAAGRGRAQPPPPRGITRGRRGPRKVPTQTRPRPLSARPRDWPRGLPIRAGVASPRREGGRRLACGAGRRGAGFAIAARPRSARERGGSGPAAPLPSAAARAATGFTLPLTHVKTCWKHDLEKSFQSSNILLCQRRARPNEQDIPAEHRYRCERSKRDSHPGAQQWFAAGSPAGSR